MRILLTGASSFTGYWFAKYLHIAGHHVVAPLLRSEDAYEDGTRLQRVAQLRNVADVVFDCPFGLSKFLDLAASDTWDLLCHHAAVVHDYRSMNFNILEAAAKNTFSLTDVLNRMKGLRSIILTGSIFEEGEGVGSLPLSSFSPYGVSKGITSQIFRFWAQHHRIPLGKFVIPNPFGPMEEPRFSSYLMGCLLKRAPIEVGTPDYVRDNIHVSLLAACYARFCEQMVDSRCASRAMQPSGYAESQASFTSRYAREIGRRLGYTADVQYRRQEVFDEPMIRINTEAAIRVAPEWQEDSAWDALLAAYQK